jgi:two-component system, chemotaxis family, chemotaxis protein CheY
MTEASSNPKCILVVDDDETVREAITETLELEGYRVDSAADGLQALEKVKTAAPDAIVLDLMMPVMDGFTFLEQCRRDELCPGTPIVVTSAVHQLAKTASALHVDACLAKPFDLDELLAIVERLLFRGLF